MLAHVRTPRLVPRRSDARGETLIEVLVTIVIMGLGFIAILSGIFTAVRISDQNAQRTKASIAVQGWAESLLQPATPIPAVTAAGQVPQSFSTYIPCAGVGTYGGPPSGALSTTNGFGGYTATVIKVEYLSGYSGGAPQWDPSQTNCYNNYYAQKSTTNTQGTQTAYFVDRGLQQITIKIDSGVQVNGQFVDTLRIIKRDKRCPGTYNNADLGPC